LIVELAQELLPYAVVLYGVDALVRVRQGERALLAPWGNRFRWTGPGWHVGGLLPTSEVFLVDGPSARASGAEASAAAAQRAAQRDLAAIRERRAAQARYSSRLSVTGVLLFGITFGALPLAVYRYHEIPFAPETAVVAAAALWTVILAVAARALRNAGATPRAVASALAPALFFPPAAAHVQSFLWRDSFRGSPALAVASVLLAPAEFRRLARQELCRLDEAEREGPGAPADPDVRAARDAILGLLSALGIDPVALAAGDAPQDALAAVFCPLCEAEYRAGFVRCTDCGVGLRPFPPTPDPSVSPAPR
jgi:hypothetical protein